MNDYEIGNNDMENGDFDLNNYNVSLNSENADISQSSLNMGKSKPKKKPFSFGKKVMHEVATKAYEIDYFLTTNRDELRRKRSQIKQMLIDKNFSNANNLLDNVLETKYVYLVEYFTGFKHVCCLLRIDCLHYKTI